MTEKWLVIGICGVTCGGKTTLATQLNNVLPNSKVISQDDYYLDENDPRQTKIPELNHVNFELLTSLDMERMHNDISRILKNRKNTIGSPKNNKRANFSTPDLEIEKLVHDCVETKGMHVLILEGFSIFNYKPVEAFCDFKYYLTLSKAQCNARRKNRVYEPPDCPGYFEQCVWPEYLKLFSDVQRNVKDVKYFHEHNKNRLKEVLVDVLECLAWWDFM